MQKMFSSKYLEKIQRTFFLLILTIVGSLESSIAQSDSTEIIDLPTAKLTALRIEVIPRKQPFSVATFQMNPALANGQQLSLQEYITEVPGLFSLNAYNYAQDLRIAIRGFGARSAFGIRGIKLIVDGIPETTPDGQGQVDNLNLSAINRIEILKGPSSALYGNASGGIINITTNNRFEKNFAQSVVHLGSFGTQLYQLGAGINFKKNNIRFSGSHSLSTGYRDNSGFKSTNLDIRGSSTIFKKSKLTYLANYTDSPMSDDPGGVNIEDVTNDRTAARDRNLLFKAGESIQHNKVGLSLEVPIKATQKLKLYTFFSSRNFEGRLPFEFGGWIDLKRQYSGNGVSYSISKTTGKINNIFQIGIDQARQVDRRKRFENLEGIKGSSTLDQREIFSNFATYALNNIEINKLMISAGLRFDSNLIKLEDEKTSDGDQSGERQMPSLNPSLGINYELAPRLHLYASFRTSFETPALSELTANPSGNAGLNESLNPQKSYNYEIGFKGLASEKFDFDLTIFHINTNNDLVPFELEDFPGRTFFRNAGSTSRQGLETWFNYQLTSRFKFRTAYTFSKFTYDSFVIDGTNFDGKLLPGIPKHSASFSLNYQTENGISARIVHRLISSIFADNANNAEIPTYQITDFNIGYQAKWKRLLLTPFFGINNLFDVEYFDNIRLNAFGSRYYEAAPGFNIYGGLRIRIE